MSFWQNVQAAAGMAGAFHWVALGFILAACIFFVFVPAERTRVQSSLLLFGLSFIGLLASGTLLSSGITPNNFAYRCLQWVSLFTESTAIIILASVFVFAVVLNGINLNPLRIVRDLLLAFAYIIVAFAAALT
jgi:hypothetical protein